MKNRHHGTKDNIPGDEPQVRDWSDFEMGCPVPPRKGVIDFLSVYSSALWSFLGQPITGRWHSHDALVGAEVMLLFKAI